MSKMKPEIKKIWVDALRGDAYKQGYKALRTKGIRYCCLGVLGDLCPLAKWSGNKLLVESDVDTKYLPTPVLEWAGLPYRESNNLAQLNDCGMSFDQIATHIEANL